VTSQSQLLGRGVRTRFNDVGDTRDETGKSIARHLRGFTWSTWGFVGFRIPRRTAGSARDTATRNARRRVPAAAWESPAPIRCISCRGTPAGWRLLGPLPSQYFGPIADELSLLSIGDRVRFTPISPAQFASRARGARFQVQHQVSSRQCKTWAGGLWSIGVRLPAQTIDFGGGKSMVGNPRIGRSERTCWAAPLVSPSRNTRAKPAPILAQRSMANLSINSRP